VRRGAAFGFWDGTALGAADATALGASDALSEGVTFGACRTAWELGTATFGAAGAVLAAATTGALRSEETGSSGSRSFAE
jgi:hypothetical protein